MRFAVVGAPDAVPALRPPRPNNVPPRSLASGRQSQRELAEAVADSAGVPAPKVSTVPVSVIKAIGVFSTDVREAAEMGYRPGARFVLDTPASEARLGLAPTPLDLQLKEIVLWWRERA